MPVPDQERQLVCGRNVIRLHVVSPKELAQFSATCQFFESVIKRVSRNTKRKRQLDLQDISRTYVSLSDHSAQLYYGSVIIAVAPTINPNGLQFRQLNLST